MNYFRLIVLTLICGAGAAADESDTDQITVAADEHYRLGREQYDKGEYSAAIKELRRSYALNHRPVTLLVVAGAYERLDDADNAAQFYQRFIESAPPGAVERRFAEMSLAEARKHATEATQSAPVAAVADGDAGDDDASETADASPLRPVEWAHQPIDTAPAGLPIPVAVQAPVNRSVKVYLYYRAAGESAMGRVVMKRHSTDKVGEIPARAALGRSVQYFIEARNVDTGALVFTAGTRTDPNLIFIK